MVIVVSREGLFELLTCIRPLLERHISDFHGEGRFRHAGGDVQTEGFCRGACAGLIRVLAIVDPSGMWRIAGGCGAECSPLPEEASKFVNVGLFPGGMSDTSGVWRGHFWIEGELDCGTTVIADLTADQFGHLPVNLVTATDDRYRKNILPRYEPLTTSERNWGHGLARRWLELKTVDIDLVAA